MNTKTLFLAPAATLLISALGGPCPAQTADTKAPPAAASQTTPPIPADAEVTVKIAAPIGSDRSVPLPFIVFQSPPRAPKPAVDEKKQRAETETLLQMIVPNSIIVQVRQNPLVKGSYVAVLTATKPMAAAVVAGAVSRAQAAVGKTVLVVANIPPPAPPDTPITMTYTLRFLRGTLPDVNAASSGTSDITGIGTDPAATDLAGFLSKVYPGDTTVTAHENRLVLTGPADQVNALRQMLALSLDVPSPQVKADIYTIQVNTTPRNRDEAQDKIEEIAAGVQLVRDFIHGSQEHLALYLGGPIAEVPAKTDPRLQKINEAGFDTDPNRPLSMTDLLVFMALSNRKELRKQLTVNMGGGDTTTLAGQLVHSLNGTREQLEKGRKIGPSVAFGLDRADGAIYMRHRTKLVSLIDRIKGRIALADGNPDMFLLDRTAKLYDTKSQGSDTHGIEAFLTDWHACQGRFLGAEGSDNEKDPTVRTLPDRLSRTSAATDLLLKKAMDALTADLQDLFFQPLMDWIRDDVRGTHARDTGIDIIGTTSITIRDRTLGETKGTAESFFKFTPIPHPTMDALTGAKTLANGTAATPDTTTQTVATDAGGIVRKANGDPLLLTPAEKLATDPATGLALRKGNAITGDPVVLTVPSTSQTRTASALASTVFGALTPLQSLALQAALNEDAVVPSYRKIAPGTSLAIRPFVLPDGGSARVQMSLSSTITPEQPSAAQLAQRDVPFDVITSHTVTTEATISAFDLQTISSFGAQTTAPGDYAWRIPLLDQIPLLGELFHGPRSRETKRQDSIAIVNLTILPRSLDLVPYYVPAP